MTSTVNSFIKNSPVDMHILQKGVINDREISFWAVIIVTKKDEEPWEKIVSRSSSIKD